MFTTALQAGRSPPRTLDDCPAHLGVGRAVLWPPLSPHLSGLSQHVCGPAGLHPCGDRGLLWAWGDWQAGAQACWAGPQGLPARTVSPCPHPDTH